LQRKKGEEVELLALKATKNKSWRIEVGIEDDAETKGNLNHF
jgi:predicted transcriptional regulator